MDCVFGRNWSAKFCCACDGLFAELCVLDAVLLSKYCWANLFVSATETLADSSPNVDPDTLLIESAWVVALLSKLYLPTWVGGLGWGIPVSAVTPTLTPPAFGSVTDTEALTWAGGCTTSGPNKPPGGKSETNASAADACHLPVLTWVKSTKSGYWSKDLFLSISASNFALRLAKVENGFMLGDAVVADGAWTTGLTWGIGSVALSCSKYSAIREFIGCSILVLIAASDILAEVLAAVSFWALKVAARSACACLALIAAACLLAVGPKPAASSNLVKPSEIPCLVIGLLKTFVPALVFAGLPMRPAEFAVPANIPPGKPAKVR